MRPTIEPSFDSGELLAAKHAEGHFNLHTTSLEKMTVPLEFDIVCIELGGYSSAALA